MIVLEARSSFCKPDHGPGTVDGVDETINGYFSQGCKPASLYSPESFGALPPYSVPYVIAAQAIGLATGVDA